jgi:hypothetical protein
MLEGGLAHLGICKVIMAGLQSEERWAEAGENARPPQRVLKRPHQELWILSWEKEDVKEFQCGRQTAQVCCSQSSLVMKLVE